MYNKIYSSVFFNKPHIVFITLLIFGLFLRLISLDNIDLDMSDFLVHWYDYIQEHGIKNAMGDAFTNYTPPYTYLLSLATLLPLPKVISIKLISIVMDAVNSFLVYKIVKLKFTEGPTALFAAAVFWCLPTVILNSATWGQCDSIYTGFLLLTVYWLIRNKPFFALVAFAVAFSFKLQTVFMAPLLIILFFRYVLKLDTSDSLIKIRWWYFLLIPAIYILVSLPTVVLGRDWVDVLTIYIVQADTYKYLSAGAPNLYFFIPGEFFDPVYKYGMIFAVMSMFCWMLYSVTQKVLFSKERLVLTALTSVTLAPFLLPNMHERYFYPADVLSLLVAFFIPRLWYLPIVFQLSSGVVYYRWLTQSWSNKPVYLAAIAITIVVIVLVKTQKSVQLTKS